MSTRENPDQCGWKGCTTPVPKEGVKVCEVHFAEAFEGYGEPPAVIDSFNGQFRFLSNFWVEENGLSNEHYYQAAKAVPGSAKDRVKAVMEIADRYINDPSAKNQVAADDLAGIIMALDTPGKTKKLGRKVNFESGLGPHQRRGHVLAPEAQVRQRYAPGKLAP